MNSLGSTRITDALFIGAFGLTMFAAAVPIFRHLAYLTPILCLIVILANGRFYLPPVIHPFLLLIALTLFYIPWMRGIALKDWYFMMSGISIGLAAGRIPLKLNWFFGLFVIGWLLNVANTAGFTGASAFSFSHSTSPLESSFSFLLGLLGVAFVAQRRWRWVAILSLLTLLSSKRIAFLGLLICVAVSWLPAGLRRRILNPFVMVALNISILALLFVYAVGLLDPWIAALTNQSANQLGMGRQYLYREAVAEMLREPLAFVFWGAGPGSAYQTLSFGSDPTAQNLHSDILKIAFEFGIVPLILFLWLLYRRGSESQKLMALYVNILFVTDNTLIYHFFLMSYVLLATWLEPIAPRSMSLVANNRPEFSEPANKEPSGREHASG